MEDVLFFSADQYSQPIPTDGTANVGSIERAFCKRAHAAVRGDPSRSTPSAAEEPFNAVPLDCPCLRAWQCGLANYDHPCLFHVPDDPLWDRIRQSVQLEAKPQPA